MLNHIVLMGRLTRDPELRRTGSIRETGKGGLAATTTGQKIAQGLQHE